MRRIRGRTAGKYRADDPLDRGGNGCFRMEECDQPRMMELTKEKMTCMAFSL